MANDSGELLSAIPYSGKSGKVEEFSTMIFEISKLEDPVL